jgi:rfaE bifunctional protein kinase chain/domain
VARIDRLSRQPVPDDVEAEIRRQLRLLATDADALLISNYRSGVVTEGVCDAVRGLARDGGPLLTADAQGDLPRFRAFDLVRVARADAAAGLGRQLETEADYASVGESLRRELGAGVVIIGRGSEGMSVVDDSGYAALPPSNVSDVFDVTGAGDTVIAVVTLALSAGLTVREAVEIANLSAGIVVRRLGVAAPTPDEIVLELDSRSPNR